MRALLLLTTALFLLTSPNISASAAPLAEPLTGRMLVGGPAAIVSNGDTFLATFSDASSTLMAVAIDRDGRRIGDAIALPRRCGSILPFRDGYLASCVYPTRHIAVLDSRGRVTGSIDTKVPSPRALATNGDAILVVTATDGHPQLRVIDANGHVLGQAFAHAETTIIDAIPTASGFAVITPGRITRIARDGSSSAVHEFRLDWSVNDMVYGSARDHVVIAASDWRGNMHTASISPTGQLTTRENVTFGIYVLHAISHGDEVLVFGRRPNDHLQRGRGAVARVSYDSTLLRFAEGLDSQEEFYERRTNVASNGHNLVVLAGLSNLYSEIVALTVPASSTASPAQEEIVSIGPLVQERIDVERFGSGALAVWREAGNGSTHIRARRIVNGAPAGDVIEVFSGARAGAPRLASAGDVALVVWAADDAVYARRIDRSGALLDAQPFRVATPSTEPQGYGFASAAAGSDGTDFLVSWVEGFYQHHRIGAVSVSAKGSVDTARTLVVGQPASTGGMSGHSDVLHAIDIAWTGDRYVVTWALERWSYMISSSGVDWRHIQMMAVSPRAEKILTTETTIGRYLTNPRLASGSGVVAVLGQADWRRGGKQVALLVDAQSAAVIGEWTLGTGQLRDFWADGGVAWTGSEFVFAWRSGGSSMLTRLPIGGIPETFALSNNAIETALTDAAGGIEYLAVVQEVNGAPSTARIVIHGADDFQRTGSRRRAIAH